MLENDYALTGPTDELLVLIDNWLGDYITQPHEKLGRNGPVCPFVEPSRRADSLVLYTADWQPEFGISHMLQVVERAVEGFNAHEWNSRNLNLHGFMVAIPDLPRAAYGLIDEAHLLSKDRVVRSGLMLGQFHPECDESAARNIDFPVNRSPVPLFAVRNMALHDILFLHDNDSWFKEYERRQGRHYDEPDRLYPEFVSLFQSARARLARSQEQAK
ncbi:DUF6875 domain-containing protein [Streptomyces sp. DT171]|uniref:DUF6875 domain-containing protein n=1 Tax=Streptomyces sp. DT171 TaxID=3416524 RepID=UPI003CEC72CF